MPAAARRAWQRTASQVTTGNIAAASDDAIAPVRSVYGPAGLVLSRLQSKATVYAVIASTGTAARELILFRFALSSTASLSDSASTLYNAEDRLRQHDVAVPPKLAHLIKVPAGAPIFFVATLEDIAHPVEARAIEADARHAATELFPDLHERETGGLGPRVLRKPCN